MTEFYNGIITCDTSSQIYHVSHSNLNLLNSFPVASLVIPLSSSQIYVSGILNRQINGFDIALTETPTANGYFINWQINIPGTGPNEYINDRRYYSKEEIGVAKLSRVHWKNIVSAPDLSPPGLRNNHNHDDRYYKKQEIVSIIDNQVSTLGSYTPVEDTLMLRNNEGRCQVNKPKVKEDVANKGYVDTQDNIILSNLSAETVARISGDNYLQSEVTAISSTYTPTIVTDEIDLRVSYLESMIQRITGSGTVFGGTDIPIGGIITYAATSAPSLDYLYCDGASFHITAQPSLYSVIGYTFGGSGSFFNVPDLRAEFIRGWDAGRGLDLGRVFGSSQLDANKLHIHTGVISTAAPHSHVGTTSGAGSHDHTINVGTAGGSAYSIIKDSSSLISPDVLNTIPDHTHLFTTSSDGGHGHSVAISGSGDIESRPRNIALSYYIKASNPPVDVPVTLSDTQTISGQKTFTLPVILPEVAQALVFGDPTVTNTLALGVVGGIMVLSRRTSGGSWVVIDSMP